MWSVLRASVSRRSICGGGRVGAQGLEKLQPKPAPLPALGLSENSSAEVFAHATVLHAGQFFLASMAVETTPGLLTASHWEPL